MHDSAPPAPVPRILLIGGQAPALDETIRILNGRYAVRTALDLPAARQAAAHELPDLLLVDLDRAAGHDAALAQAVLQDQTFAGLPAIFLISTEPHTIDEDNLLLRPFTPRELISCIQSHLRMAGLRRQMDQALRLSEDRYRAIVEGQSEMVSRFHPDGTLLFVNGAYARARGATPDELIHANFWDWVEEEDRPAVRDMLQRITPQSPEIRIENRFETADGVRWTLWTNRGLAFDEAGRPTELQSAGIDITHRKRAEQALRQLNETLEERVEERTRQVRQLLARLTMAEQEERRYVSQILHDDLQQLLYGIEMKMAIIESDLSQAQQAVLQAELREARAWINQAIKTTRMLTVDLSPPILKDEGLADALQWLQSQMRELHGLEVELHAEHRFYLPDEDMRVLLFHVVRELLFNVKKHARVGRAAVRLWEEGQQMVIEVHDNGAGFDATILEKRGSPQRGFGLFNIRERLKLLGGRLEVISNPEEGTRVQARLPLKV